MNDYEWDYAFNTMYAGESERWEYGVGTKKEYSDYGKNALHYTQVLNQNERKIFEN